MGGDGECFVRRVPNGPRALVSGKQYRSRVRRIICNSVRKVIDQAQVPFSVVKPLHPTIVLRSTDLIKGWNAIPEEKVKSLPN